MLAGNEDHSSIYLLTTIHCLHILAGEIRGVAELLLGEGWKIHWAYIAMNALLRQVSEANAFNPEPL